MVVTSSLVLRFLRNFMFLSAVLVLATDHSTFGNVYGAVLLVVASYLTWVESLD